jgi:hypothetical protein
MEFRNINIKTGFELEMPPKVIENSYLEFRLGDVSESNFAVGKMYEGINADDVRNLENQGLHIIFSSGRSAYFGDEATAKLAKEIFPNQSDAVAYGNLPTSEGKKSAFRENVKVLVIDDESPSPDWGKEPIVSKAGAVLSDRAMSAIAAKLGDSYNLISPSLGEELDAEPNRPFQFRAGVPEWQGMMKGMCRESVFCDALGVDAIISKSSIKGDNKETATGIQEVDLFWSRKEDAKLTEQKLGTQVLVYFPEAAAEEVAPLLKANAEKLAEVQSDPRRIAELYIKRHEQQLAKNAERQEEIEIKPLIDSGLAKELGLSNLDFQPRKKEVEEDKEYKSWVYDVLKTDIGESGNCQVLEMPEITKQLEKFMRKEWADTATGGVYVPSGIAQPSNELKSGEVCFKKLPDGIKVGIYRSPVANAANFDVFTNNLEVLKNNDPEAYAQKGVCYMNPDDAKRLVIDFDGDRIGIIPGELTPEQQAQSRNIEQFPKFIKEIVDKNMPEEKPVQVEKEKKISRSPENGFPDLASAAIDSADNPTGKVANLGMKLEALRWDIQNTPDDEKLKYLTKIGKHFENLLEKDENLTNDLRDQLGAIASIAKNDTKVEDPRLKKMVIEVGLERTEGLLWGLENTNAVNLQRAVDTPKSARKVDEKAFEISSNISRFKKVEWIADKDNELAYMGGRSMATNTNDPIGLIVEQTNKNYREGNIIAETNKDRFDHILPKNGENANFLDWSKAIAAEYGGMIGEAISAKNQRKTEEEISITATSGKGNQIEIVAPSKADPEGKSPIWNMAKFGESVDIKISTNTDWKTKEIYPAKAVAILDNNVMVDIGLVSPETMKTHGNSLIGKELRDLKLDYKLGRTSDDVKDMFASAEKFLEAKAAEIPEEEKLSRATALWQNNTRAIAGKMFTDTVVGQLQELQVDKIKVIGMQYATHGHQWQPKESIDCRIAIESDPENKNYGNRLAQFKENNVWQNIGVFGKEDAYMPIGSEFKAEIKVSPIKTNGELIIDKTSMKLPDVWQGLSPVRIKEAVDIDAIAPSLKEKIIKATEGKPSVTEFVQRLAAENIGLKAQVQQNGRVIHGLTYKYEDKLVKASLIEMPWNVLKSMGVNYDKDRDLAALIPKIENGVTLNSQNSPNLQAWKETAEYLGRGEKYVGRIQELMQGGNLSENAQKAMVADHQSLGEQTADSWRKILSSDNGYNESQGDRIVFERKGSEGKYRASWERETDTLILDSKMVDQGSIKYSPLLIQKGAKISENKISVKDAKNVDLALKMISEKQKETQSQR